MTKFSAHKQVDKGKTSQKKWELGRVSDTTRIRIKRKERLELLTLDHNYENNLGSCLPFPLLRLHPNN